MVEPNDVLNDGHWEAAKRLHGRSFWLRHGGGNGSGRSRQVNLPRPGSGNTTLCDRHAAPAFPDIFLEHLGFMVNRTAEKLNAQVERVVLPYSLTVGQYSLLLLQAAGPQAQIVLSQRVGLERVTVLRSMDALKHRALVRRGPQPTDRRKHRVALPEARAALLSRTLPDIGAAEREVTDVHSKQEQERLCCLNWLRVG